jgi:ribosomal protein S18 acetylase RimI-like enzyme
MEQGNGAGGGLVIRRARATDVAAIAAVDPVARHDEERRAFIRASVASKATFVALADDAIVGYVVFDHTFFGRGFIEMLFVDPDRRRSGVGSALMRHVERACRTERIFTSTNASNTPMQALLHGLGYGRSGVVGDLDPGDPEMIYSRPLRGPDAQPIRRDALALRPYEAHDEDAVVELWTRCDLVRPWNDPRRDIARKLGVQRELFVVALRGDALVGTVMAGFEGHRGWINYLAVDPAWRGRGIARALMAHAEGGLEVLGCPKVNLQVRAGNASALACYGRLGYARDEVVSLGKRLRPDDGA